MRQLAGPHAETAHPTHSTAKTRLSERGGSRRPELPRETSTTVPKEPQRLARRACYGCPKNPGQCLANQRRCLRSEQRPPRRELLAPVVSSLYLAVDPLLFLVALAADVAERAIDLAA